MSDVCSVCCKHIEELGSLIYLDKVAYCKECKGKTWDLELGQQYYEALFVNCPFCKERIDITATTPDNCPGCNVFIDQPGFCGFCESNFVFRKKRVKQ